MDESIVFLAFQGNNVRVLQRDDGLWWVARDVCDFLGFGNSRQAISTLESYERSGVHIMDPHGRSQKTTIINESGLYNLVFRSHKPEALAFKRWVTEEVLPRIRMTGQFSTRPQDNQAQQVITELSTQNGVLLQQHGQLVEQHGQLITQNRQLTEQLQVCCTQLVSATATMAHAVERMDPPKRPYTKRPVLRLVKTSQQLQDESLARVRNRVAKIKQKAIEDAAVEFHTTVPRVRR